MNGNGMEWIILNINSIGNGYMKPIWAKGCCGLGRNCAARILDPFCRSSVRKITDGEGWALKPNIQPNMSGGQTIYGKLIHQR